MDEETDEGEFLESEVHKHLDTYRVSNKREFFTISVKEAQEIIEELGKKYI